LLEREERVKGLIQRVSILPLIESPKGVMNAYEIGKASERVAALGFGAGDFLRELGEGFTIAKMSPEEYFPILLYARSSIATAACALGIAAIDTPFFGLLIDTTGLELEAFKAKLLGFKGKMLTHPRHVPTVNRVFSPSSEDVQLSRRMIAAYKEAEELGRGSAILDGKMIDMAMYKMGMDVISKAGEIEKKDRERAEMGDFLMWLPTR
jgi:citrate lyase subunit beta/citryl-CoA lyase